MEILLRFERETLAPYELPGNRVSRNMYDDLSLPWNISIPIKEFPHTDYIKLDYDRDGKLSNGATFFGNSKISSMDEIEKDLATASMVTRWRAANPTLAGTEQDVVKVFIRELREALGGQDWMENGNSTAILLFKRPS